MRDVAGMALERVYRAIGKKTDSEDELQGKVASGAAARELGSAPGWSVYRAFLDNRRAELLRMLVHGDEGLTKELRAKLQEIDYLAGWQERAETEGKNAEEILNGR